MSEEFRMSPHEAGKIMKQTQEGGFHFERDLEPGRKMEIITDQGIFEAVAKEDGIYMRGASPLSDEFELVRIFGIPERNGDPSERMESNYINISDMVEVLLVNKDQQISIGPVKGFKLLSE